MPFLRPSIQLANHYFGTVLNVWQIIYFDTVLKWRFTQAWRSEPLLPGEAVPPRPPPNLLWTSPSSGRGKLQNVDHTPLSGRNGVSRMESELVEKQSLPAKPQDWRRSAQPHPHSAATSLGLTVSAPCTSSVQARPHAPTPSTKHQHFTASPTCMQLLLECVYTMKYGWLSEKTKSCPLSLCAGTEVNSVPKESHM